MFDTGISNSWLSDLHILAWFSVVFVKLMLCCQRVIKLLHKTIYSLPKRSVCPEFICSKCWVAGYDLNNACWSRVSLSVRWVGLSGRVHAVMYKVPDPCMC